MGDKLSERNEIKDAFLRAIESLKDGYLGHSLTDIFIQMDNDSGELLIFDDENNKIIEEIIPTWEERSNSDLSEDEVAERNLKGLRHIVTDLNKEGAFSDLDIFKPFSVSLMDDDSEILEELLLIDDDSIIFLEDDFLEKLEKDFDDFVNELLKE